MAAGTIEAAVAEAFAADSSIRPGKWVDGVEVGDNADAGIHVATSEHLNPVEIGLPGDSTDVAAADGAAVFQDVASATSLIVQPVDVDLIPELRAGVRTLITIESLTAPTAYAFPLELPVGASTEGLPDGSVAVVNVDGSVLGMFASPWAVDAAGQSLPTWFEVTAEGIVQHVDHRGATYPVVADPAWFIPLIIVGVRTMVPIVVKAASKAAAKRAAAAAAKAAAKKAGSTVKSIGAVTKIRFYTAGGYRIRPGVRIRTGYNSFADFKKRFGSRKDYDWHHVVEQRHATGGRKFGNKSIHNKNNLVQVPREIHRRCLSSIMATKPATGPIPYRVFLGVRVGSGQTMSQAIQALGTYEKMHAAGIRVLRYCGVPI